MKLLKIGCFLLPFLGFLLIIILWLFKKDELADELLFICSVGFIFSIVALVPLYLLLSSLSNGLSFQFD